MPDTHIRQVYMVLSPRSLGYARVALASLFRNSLQPLKVHLITDSAADARELTEAASGLDYAHTCSITAEEELADAESHVFAGLDHLRAFRHGHPCWRKITDPLLMGAPGEELVLLDPDLCFPNRFTFEQTPGKGLLLMWQKPNCLLPPEIVRTSINAGVKLARHVDVGVAHWRAGTDLEWLNWLIQTISSRLGPLPRVMHVEAIVWAAIAMREGGGYLDPALWVCWHRTQTKRLRRKLGANGNAILASEPWPTLKCFHAGGEAKWWVPDYAPSLSTAEVTRPGAVTPFIELTRGRYEQEQRMKGVIRNLGYYKLFRNQAA